MSEDDELSCVVGNIYAAALKAWWTNSSTSTITSGST